MSQRILQQPLVEGGVLLQVSRGRQHYRNRRKLVPAPVDCSASCLCPVEDGEEVGGPRRGVGRNGFKLADVVLRFPADQAKGICDFPRAKIQSCKVTGIRPRRLWNNWTKSRCGSETR